MAWGTFSTVEKVASIIVSVAAVLGVLNVGYQHFMTDNEAMIVHDHLSSDLLTVQQTIAVNQEKSNKRAVNSDISRHAREIARLERDLTAGELGLAERQFILREIDRLELLQQCLREGTCDE